MSTSAKLTNYMPQLDALRALAVLLVLMHHWLPSDSWWNYLPTGPMGVTLFFVLSGFLISRILLVNRRSIENQELSGKEVLYTFYVRRALRIFPLYFLVIFICLSLNVENIASRFTWFVTYSSNLMHFREERWMGALSHLWTLAVEEQYYLFIPMVLLFVPRKYLSAVIWTCILIGPATRLLIYFFLPSEHPEITTSVLPFSSMDCFGLGTLLAYVRSEKSQSYNEKFDLSLWSAFVISAVVFMFMLTFGIQDLTTLLLRSLFSIICLYVIDLASKGIKGPTKLVLENKVLLYFGKISYGIYIFHMFMPFIWEKASPYFADYKLVQFLETENRGYLFLLFFVCTIAIASFSWFWIEKPLNELKVYFEYNKRKQEMTSGSLPQLGFGVGFVFLLYIFLVLNNPGTKASTHRISPKLFPLKSTGLYVEDFNQVASDTSFSLPDDIPFQYDLVSLYLAWGESSEFDLPASQIQKMEKEGKQVFITWEPWTSTFPQLKIDNKEVYQKVREGAFDTYLIQQARLLNTFAKPVYIRWAHNADRLDCPWSAISHKEIEQYKMAHLYLQRFFDTHAKGKVKWVWPAPRANRLADYLPEHYRADVVGIPVINKGKNMKDENWREFGEIYQGYEKAIAEESRLRDTPLFLTEMGMEYRTPDETNWYRNAFSVLNEKENIGHVVIFGFHKPLIKQFFRNKTNS